MKNALLLPARLTLAATALAALAGAAHALAPVASPDMVGEATLVIGQAKLFGADGVARPVDRGTAIRVGDRIETAAGGHVHLRFVDGARLSVRPSSRLQVEHYSRSGDQPALTAIKFRLDEGVVRSITGAWGEAARERFRLNTPVAAIGVKGTDFVVKSDANNTLATVYTGAILLTPLAGGCQTSLGPCLNGSEKLLSEDMKGQMLTLSRQQTSPQLVPAVDLLAQRARPAQVETSAKTDTARADLSAEKVLLGEGKVVDAVASAQHTALQSALPPQLVWARLAAVAADGDTLSRSYAQAIENNRQIVTGNFTHSLYRQQDAGMPAVLAGIDTAPVFRLDGASGQVLRYDPRTGAAITETLQINGGSLLADFSRATYATQLAVAAPSMGANSISSAGVIATNGTFRASSGDYTSGAFSLDGKEAAYFFNKAIGTAGLSGITHWGR